MDEFEEAVDLAKFSGVAGANGAIRRHDSGVNQKRARLSGWDQVIAVAIMQGQGSVGGRRGCGRAEFLMQFPASIFRSDSLCFTVAGNDPNVAKPTISQLLQVQNGVGEAEVGVEFLGGCASGKLQCSRTFQTNRTNIHTDVRRQQRRDC